MKHITLTDPINPYIEIKLLCTPVNKHDKHWGEFELFRNTSWENVVCVIPGDIYTHALHGRLDPLLKQIGREPVASLRKIVPDEGECSFKGNCSMWDEQFCKPGGYKGKGYKRVWGPPDCYDIPIDGPVQVKQVFYTVLQALKTGHYIVVVQGEGFNFA